MAKEKRYPQQGDVIMKYREVSNIPESARQVKPITRHNMQQIILQHGESSGHAHAIKDVEGVTVYEDGVGDDQLFWIKTKDRKVKVTHEEHDASTLQPNKVYERSIVRMYNFFDAQVTNVVD